MIVNSVSEWIGMEYLGFQILVEQIEDFEREFGQFETTKGNTFYKLDDPWKRQQRAAKL